MQVSWYTCFLKISEILHFVGCKLSHTKRICGISDIFADQEKDVLMLAFMNELELYTLGRIVILKDENFILSGGNLRV